MFTSSMGITLKIKAMKLHNSNFSWFWKESDFIFNEKLKYLWKDWTLCMIVHSVYIICNTMHMCTSLTEQYEKESIFCQDLLILSRFSLINLDVPDFLPYSEHKNWESFPGPFLDQSKYRASWHGVCRSSSLRLYWNLFSN